MFCNTFLPLFSVNEITTLADFQECHQLQELYIRKNKIKNLNEICYLKKLTKLRNLWLADNPCATGSMYRMTVLRNLPNLVKLDNIGIFYTFIINFMKRCCQGPISAVIMLTRFIDNHSVINL